MMATQMLSHKGEYPVLRSDDRPDQIVCSSTEEDEGLECQLRKCLVTDETIAGEINAMHSFSEGSVVTEACAGASSQQSTFRRLLMQLWDKNRKRYNRKKTKSMKKYHESRQDEYDDISTTTHSTMCSSTASTSTDSNASLLFNNISEWREHENAQVAECLFWDEVYDDEEIANKNPVWLAYGDDVAKGVEMINRSTISSVLNNLTEVNGRETVASIDLKGSNSSPVNSKHKNISLMQQRLEATGLVDIGTDYDFVPDRVSKEVLGLILPPAHLDADKNFKVSHVKTGIWEIICYDKNDEEQPPEYIVTGVLMDQRVDTKKLRKVVASVLSPPLPVRPRRVKVRLAPTEIAQELAGYKSGTMAPICHTVNLPLFIEETIFLENGRGADHRVQCGSGIFGKCLSIGTDKFLAIADQNPFGLQVIPLIQSKKTKEARAHSHLVNEKNQGCKWKAAKQRIPIDCVDIQQPSPQ